MTRTEAIAVISSRLASLADEDIRALAEIAQLMTANGDLPRTLTPEELDLIQQSKEDFVAGRSYSLAEARAITDEFLAPLGVAPSRA